MNRKLSLILLLIILVAFGVGITRLFNLRFESGDVYPEYSSLRSDPLGTSAFYESLEQLPGVAVSRDCQDTDQLPEGRDVAYLHLAGSAYEWTSIPESSFNEIEHFVMQGGRLVITLLPQTGNSYESLAAKKKKADEAEAKKAAGKDPAKSKSKKSLKQPRQPGSEQDDSSRSISLKDRWGFEFKFQGMETDAKGAHKPVTVESDDPALPPSISWHSGLVFTNLNQAWRIVYSRGSEPVLVERKFGSGSVVLSTDSYFISNEAMAKERHADLLAWVVSPSRRVVFDEAHLGIVQSPGVSTLIRKYRLHGLVVGLLLLAALFIWKNSVPFVPTRGNEALEAFVAGRDSAAGFVNLLRRHVSSKELLNVCLVEWKKSFAHGKYSASRMRRVEAMIKAEMTLSAMERNPVRTYQAICRALKENPSIPISSIESKPTK